MKEPRYILRAVAEPGKDIESYDFEFLVQVDGKTYDLMPNLVKMEIKTCKKITMLVELDVSELEIDMPATLIDKDGNKTASRIKLSGSNPDYALNSSCINCEIEDQSDVYVKDLTLLADGREDGNKIVAHTIMKTPPNCKYCDESTAYPGHGPYHDDFSKGYCSLDCEIDQKTEDENS